MNEKRHSELEVKFAAGHVDSARFRKVMVEANTTAYEQITHDDVFYQCGENVVRHRLRNGAGELTVKKRKSAESLTDRVEINLRFAEKNTIEDVVAFLEATGYHRLFTLRKVNVDVFEFKRADYTMEAVLYTVGKLNEGMGGDEVLWQGTYLELEIRPGENMPHSESLETLSYWTSWARRQFDLAEPLNLSLFEYYSQQGTNYKI